jgi:ribosome-binding protein aMBF1 (putative translation factor)
MRGPHHEWLKTLNVQRLTIFVGGVMGFLSRAIRHAPENRQWSQSELAARLKVSQAAISFWENGVEEPSLMRYVELLETMPEI